MNTRARNISGQRFGKLTAIALIGKDTTGKRINHIEYVSGEANAGA